MDESCYVKFMEDLRGKESSKMSVIYTVNKFNNPRSQPPLISDDDKTPTIKKVFGKPTTI